MSGRTQFLFLGTILLLVNFASAEQVSDVEQFTTWLQGIESFEAEFLQRTRTASGEVEMEFEGIVKMNRPSSFWWEIREPYSLYFLLRNNEVIEFDPDLEQVTYRKLSDLGEVPIVSILLQKDVNLQERFDIQAEGNHFLLEPKSESELFQTIAIYFKRESIDAIDVVDHNNHTTEFTFKNLSLNIDFSKDAFDLHIPENIDVIGTPQSDPASMDSQ